LSSINYIGYYIYIQYTGINTQKYELTNLIGRISEKPYMKCKVLIRTCEA